MIRAAVKIAYLGEHFHGSQIQHGCRTVEGDILSDLKIITKMHSDEIDLKLASRTDRGVNALGNVAVFNSNIDDLNILLRALNAVSKDIYYRSAAFVDKDFNPRFADVRQYRYTICIGCKNVEAMKACAELFEGEHDFTRFCKPEGKSATLVLNCLDVHEDGCMAYLDFTAKYYLWNMVRRVVAAIAAVGMGESTLSDVQDALEGKGITFGLARPEALTLQDISYKDVEFFAFSSETFEKRVEEKIFENTLRSMFFTSL